MKKLLSAATCLFASLIASPAFASIPTPSNQWQTIAATPDGKALLVDVGSVVRQGNIAKYWLQLNDPRGDIFRAYSAGDCSKKVMQTAWRIKFNSNGQILSNEQSLSRQEATVLNSPLRLALDTACGNNSPEMQAQAAQAAIVQAQLEALNRARQTNADAIGNAMRTTADLFK